jgi:hypothetical protein
MLICGCVRLKIQNAHARSMRKDLTTVSRELFSRISEIFSLRLTVVSSKPQRRLVRFGAGSKGESCDQFFFTMA